MTQQIINLGSGPDTQTGDSLYVAFTKVNDNFTELYSVFDGNGISNINANVIISNNVVVSSNIRTGNLAAYGNIEAIGYIITAGAFYPNGIPIGSLGSIDSNVLPLVTNVYTIGSSSLQFTQGYFSTNITLSGSNVTVRNGALFVDGQMASGNYGNSNVASFLPVYNGNISATITTSQQPYITQTGTLSNLTANVARIYGNLVVDGNLTVDGNVTFFNVDNLLVEDPIITLNTGANGSPLIANNGFDSGVQTYYYDTENRKSFFGRKNDTGYFEYYSNVITDVGNIVSGTYGTIKTGNLELTQEANVVGNVTANYFLGNGRFLNGIDTTLISNGNSNVKVYQNGNISISSAGVANIAEFTTQGGNISGDFYITGTIKALNYIGNVSGNLSAPGADTQVIFNDNSVAGATSGFTFDKTANSVFIAGDLITGGQAYLSNLTILGNTVYVVNSGDNIVLQPDGTANVYIGQPGLNNQLVVSGNIHTEDNIIVNGITVIDANANVVTSRLQDSGVVSGTYGNASSVPVITVDQKGRITSVSTTAVAGVNNLTYDSVVSNLTIYTSAGTTFSVDLGVGSSDSPEFANANITNTLFTNNLNITSFVTGNLIPSANIVYDLGTNVARWRDLYLSGSSIYLDNLVLSSNSFGLSISGNLSTNNIFANGAGTFENTLQAKEGLQNTVIGNVTPTTAQFTTVNTSGNITAAAINSNGSITVGSTLYAAGGVQNTVIGNITPQSAQFTTVSASGNVTGSELTVNGSMTSGTTLQAQGGIQNTPIGNVTPSTALFTTVGASGNATVNAISVNNSATIGNTLSVTANVQVGNLRTAGTVLITNTINSTGANTGALIVQGGASFEKDIHVLGNVYATNIVAINANTLSVQDPLLYLTANTPYPYNYDIGFYSQFQTGVSSGYQHTGFVRDVDDGVWKLFSNVVPEPTITIDFTNAVYDRILSGGLTSLGSIIGNSTLSIFGNSTIGNLTVNSSAVVGTTLQAQGGIQNTPIGNITPSTAQFTTINSSGNATVNALTVNNSMTVGSTLSVTGNIAAPNFLGNFVGNISGNLTAPGSNTQILFNDAGLIAGDSGLTYNKTTDQLTVLGNVVVAGLSSTGSATLGQTLSVSGGIQNTPIGNITASTGQFTTVSATGNVTGAALTSNGSITAITSLSALGGIQNTPIGNITPSSGLFTSIGSSGNATVNALTVNVTTTIGSTLGVVGNINSSSLTLSGSMVSAGPAQHIGGLQATPIGNVTASTGQFTTVSATGNITGAALTANGSITAGTTLRAAGGIQNTVIGNITPTSAQFTTINTSGNAVVSGLTVNVDSTIGGNLSVSNTLSTGQISISGGIQNTPIGNNTPSTGNFTILNSTGNTAVSALTVNSTVTIGSSLGVSGVLTISNTTPSTSNVTGAVRISGGLGVAGNVYVGQRVGFVAANSVSAVYQIYNPSTNSLDTIFG